MSIRIVFSVQAVQCIPKTKSVNNASAYCIILVTFIKPTLIKLASSLGLDFLNILSTFYKFDTPLSFTKRVLTYVIRIMMVMLVFMYRNV